MSHYIVSPDGWGDLTIWDWAPTSKRPRAVVSKCDVSEEAWGLLLRGVEATA